MRGCGQRFAVGTAGCAVLSCTLLVRFSFWVSFSLETSDMGALWLCCYFCFTSVLICSLCSTLMCCGLSSTGSAAPAPPMGLWGRPDADGEEQMQHPVLGCWR